MYRWKGTTPAARKRLETKWAARNGSKRLETARNVLLLPGPFSGGQRSSSRNGLLVVFGHQKSLILMVGFSLETEKAPRLLNFPKFRDLGAARTQASKCSDNNPKFPDAVP